MVKNACDAILGLMLMKNNNVVFVAILATFLASKPLLGENFVEKAQKFLRRQKFRPKFLRGGHSIILFYQKSFMEPTDITTYDVK